MTHPKILDEIIKNKQIVFNNMEDWQVWLPEIVLYKVEEFRKQGYKIMWMFGKELDYFESASKEFDDVAHATHKFLTKDFEFRSDLPERKLKILIKKIGIRMNPEDEIHIIYENPLAGDLYTLEEKQRMD